VRPIIHCDLVNGPFGDPVLYADFMFEGLALLFDMGDLSALPPRKLLRVSHAFVSHTHMDHFADFDRLLRLLLGRDKTISLYGPADFIDRVQHKLQSYTWNVVQNYVGNLVLDICEVHIDGSLPRARFQSRRAFRREDVSEGRMEDDVLAKCGTARVRTAVLDHGTPCLGFALEEPLHVNVWKTRLDAMGLEVGKWLSDLKRAVVNDLAPTTPVTALRRVGTRKVPIVLPLAELRHVVQTVPGQKVAYIVDVAGHAANAARIERLAADADTLFIECAFLHSELAHATRKNHLTAWQAGLLARRARVRRLVPCHYSARYAGCGDELAREAGRAFDAGGPHVDLGQ
jgi:ribonuclease Z